MSFSSPYIIKKILEVFKVETPVEYVAILDYEGNIKAQMIKNGSENTSTFQLRCVDGARAIRGMYQSCQKFFDETNLIIISNENNTEFICFSKFVIYVMTKLTENEESIVQVRKQIKKLESDLQKLFKSNNENFEKYDEMHNNRP